MFNKFFASLIFGAVNQIFLFIFEVKMKSKESGPIKGIVRMTDRKCGLNIEVRSKDGVKMYHPINLPEDYKVDGKIIVFNYSAFDSGNIVKCEVENRIKVSNVKPAQRFPVKL